MKRNWVKDWTEISVAFDTPKADRSSKQYEITKSGLCAAMWGVGRHYETPRILVRDEYGYWWPRNKTGTAYRATFAGLMAAMGNKGFEDFLAWCREHPK